MSTENLSTDRLVEEIYERLSAFRKASDQLAEHARQSSITSESWKTATLDFTRTVEDTRDSMTSLVNASQATVDQTKVASADVRSMISEIQSIGIEGRFDALVVELKEVRELLIDLQTRQQSRIRSIEVSLDVLHASVLQSKRVSILCGAAGLVLLAIILIKML